MVCAANGWNGKPRLFLFLANVADHNSEQAYFIYKLVRIFSPSSGERYESAKKTLTIFSILSFLMLLATVRSSLPFLSAVS